MCALLIDRGTDVNAKNRYGRTPLHLASFKGHKDMCALLIDHGADVTATEGEGRKPLDMAHKKVRKLLRVETAKKTVASRRMDLLTLMAVDDDVTEDGALRILDQYGGECGGQESRFWKAISVEIGKKRSRDE